MVERAEEVELLDLRAVEGLLGRTVGHHGHARLRWAIALYKPTSLICRVARLLAQQRNR